jgi:hypothetical protein
MSTTRQHAIRIQRQVEKTERPKRDSQKQAKVLRQRTLEKKKRNKITIPQAGRTGPAGQCGSKGGRGRVHDNNIWRPDWGRLQAPNGWHPQPYRAHQCVVGTDPTARCSNSRAGYKAGVPLIGPRLNKRCLRASSHRINTCRRFESRNLPTVARPPLQPPPHL